MYVAPTCLDPKTVEACREALDALSRLKRRDGFSGTLRERQAAIARAAERLRATFTPAEIEAARGQAWDPRELAQAYADANDHRNPRGAWRLRRWAAA